ncbi:MAG: hypothetical protein O3A46_14570, partial [Candidatus Poribacteria bacterium]|nr:hypothetical protein [Candidatus Poribacteria bacterium]
IAELQSAEIKRDALLSTGRSPLSAEIRALNTQAQMLQANVRKLEAGGGNYLSRSGLQKLPMLEREYVVLMRERTVQETLFAMMAQEFEVAKIQESQDEMRFQSLDRARPRAKPIRPSNRANAMIGAMLGGVLSGAYALLRLTIAGNAAPRRDPEPIT